MKDKINDLGIMHVLKESGRRFYRNIHWSLLIMVIDLVFIFLLSGVMTIVQISAIDHLSALMEMGGSATGGVINMYETPASVMYGLQGLGVDEIFQFHVRRLILYLGVMVLAGYVCWVLFQGLSWWLLHRFCVDRSEQRSYLSFMKDFSLQSLFFYIFFVLLIGLWVKAFIYVKTSLAPLIGPTSLSVFFWILAGVLWYFGILSYTMTHKQSYRNVKESFIFGSKKFLYVVQTLAVITVLFLAIHFILKIPYLLAHPGLFTVVGLLLVMPFFVFGRILLIETRIMYWPMIHVHEHHKPAHKSGGHGSARHEVAHKRTKHQ